MTLASILECPPSLLTTNFFYNHRLPVLQIAGMSKPLKLPSSDPMLRKVAERYPKKSATLLRRQAVSGENVVLVWGPKRIRQTTIVPAADVEISDDWTSSLHCELSTVLKCIRPDDRLALSHLSIDSLHDAASLAPITRHDDAIATLVVLLAPADACQLGLDFVQKDSVATHPWRELETHCVHYALLSPETKLVGTGTTVRKAPPRVALVFHVLRASLHADRDVGPIYRSILFLKQLAMHPPLGLLYGVHIHLCRRHAAPDWGALEPTHTALLDALLASECYGIGLAVYSEVDGILHFARHHQSATVASTDLRHVQITELVTPPSNRPRYGINVVLVFWPKQHLVNVMGGAAFATAMRAEAPAVARAFVADAASVFCTTSVVTRSHRGHPPPPTTTRCSSCSTTLATSTAFVAFCDTPWIQNQLAKYGWEPLADALNILVSRWCSDNGVEHATLLVASLAGVTNAPVCAPLDQDYVYECIRRLWATLHTAFLKPHVLEPMPDDTLQQIVADALYMEHYCDRGADTDRWLQAHLPAVALSLVDGFLWPPTASVVDVVCKELRRPLVHLPLAFSMALAHNTALNLESLLNTMLHHVDACVKDVVVTQTSLMRLLWLLERDPSRCLDQAYLQASWRQWACRFGLEALVFVGEASALTPSICAALSARMREAA
ncbi:hypothetical protein SDRG_15648 [Saprolegnia diclina VS20]|uniref:Uncharacterized protein n=1 Tax=Saprolegnia diclina (strain VS20) TaxID=1156394 RepID=T0RAJ5_SAPDV|nr:hypothetical protein SDRG_15648 [Saprolegnia diclina VS20]EQC26557.1 hypothetical protein SDRG_15648 [Saprolegnia diclina VS20]|eukprot:XP_008620050.1 hypothetical protein SDRG_15648 [Saprolegnia diclina VS20]